MTNQPHKQVTDRPDLRRRDLLLTLAGASIGSLPLGSAIAAIPSNVTPNWSSEADVVVVGTGAAATSAAISAASNGARVIMLEKMPFRGGTTMKSGGVFWIPNNPYLRSQGIVDDRTEALRYMVRLAFPTLYRPDHQTLGIPAADYEKCKAYYDNASAAVEKLMAATGMKISPWMYADGEVWPDYYAHFSEDKVKRGRSLVCDMKEHPERAYWAGHGGAGEALLWVLQASFDKLGIKVLLNHSVTALTQNSVGEINGVRVDNGNAAPIYVRAVKAVIFGSGGFTHNVRMADTFLRGRIWGGCAAPGSTGDFIAISAGVGAQLGNMNNAWWAELSVEQALETRSVPSNVWCSPGDSMLTVNRYGKRFGNEKISYNERAQLHFTWDAEKLEYPNLLGFMIWDKRTADAYSGFFPLPAAGAKPSYLIEGETLSALQANITSRLSRIAEHTGGIALHESFAENFKATLHQFNMYATSGKDIEFQRGETPNEVAWQYVGIKPVSNPYPNPALYPISSSGPYFAMILGAGTLDTKGGPLTNAKGQILGSEDRPIPGLYGAGNCIASPAAQAYWGGGATIGSALTFGYLSGTAAVSEPDKAI